MNILLADDHAVVREGFIPFLETLAPQVKVLEAGDFDSAMALVAATPDIDLIILDLYMPGMNGTDGVKAMRDALPAVPLAVLSGSIRQQDAREVLACGAAGYLPKTMRGKALINALRLIIGGERYIPAMLVQDQTGQVEAVKPQETVNPRLQALTVRERAILAAVVDGKTNKAIARDLELHEVTVKAHVRSIFRKLGVTNRTEAAKVVHQAGGLTVPNPA